MSTIFFEGFETNGNGVTYATSIAEFSDGSGDFFIRTDGSVIGSFVNYTGGEGSFFFAGMDLDGEGAAATQTITFGNINITNFANLSFSGLFAEDDNGSSENWDASDSVIFEYRIDGSDWINLLAFKMDGSETDGTNGFPSLDTDFDGVGDSTELTPTFTQFSADITSTGSNLDIRATLSLNAGDEDFAMDAITVTGDLATFDLQITEIWPGNAEGENLTADWFEITNVGGAAWTSADGMLYFDDDSQDPTTADLLSGVTQIAPGESVVFVDDDSVDEFFSVWGSKISLGKVGTYDGSGLSGGGDAVTLFLDAGNDGVLVDDIVDFEAYPDAEAAMGASYDVDNSAFSNTGGTSGQGTDVVETAGNDESETAVGSPTNGAAITATPAFTLELFHIGDQEGSTAAIENAPNLSAVLAALKDQDLGDDGEADNTLFLSSGDAIIPGVFFNASEAVFGSGGIGDIQIQNELGIQAMALGNHEFDLGTGTLSSLITGEDSGSPIGDFTALTNSALAGEDFEGADFAYLSTNLDYSTDGNMAPLEVSGGSAPVANTVTSSVAIDVNGEDIGVVGATTPTLASISSAGSVGISPTWASGTPTDAELDALAAEIQAEVDALLTANSDMNKVVLLSHMQQIEIEYALAERLSGVDIIVAGGSNTRLADDTDRLRDGDSNQGDYPQFRTDADGNSVAIVNTDGSYKYLGRLVIDFDADGNVIADSYDEDVSGIYATDDAGVLDVAAPLLDFEMSEGQQTNTVPDGAATGSIKIDAFDPTTNMFTLSGSFSGLMAENGGNALRNVGAVDSEGNPQSAIHLHGAPAGSNGGIVRNFTVTDNGDGSGSFTGTFTFTAQEMADFLAGNTYVNLHTTDFGPGQLRGQVDIPAALASEGLIDPEIQEIVDALEAQIIATESNVFGFSDVYLNANRSGTGANDDPDGVRTQETNLGNLTADANLWLASQTDADVVLSLKNGGGIRASIGEIVVPAGGTEAIRSANGQLVDGDGNEVKPEGGISQTDIETTLSFNNDLVLMTLTVEEIVALLEHGVASSPVSDGQFAHISGAKFSFDDDLPSGARIVDAALEASDGTLTPLVVDGDIQNPTDTYRIVTLGFMSSPRFDSDGNFIGAGDGFPFPNSNTDAERGELGDPAVIARMDIVFLEEEGVQSGNATFADNGTEQDALAEYLVEFHGTAESAFDQADTGPESDARIQNLDFVSSTIFPDFGPAFFSFVQDFDSESTGGFYTDTGDANVDHDLINNAGEAPVDSEVSGIDLNGQLAFDASYVNTRNSSGLTDGDFVGVTSFTGRVGSYTSGTQGYQMSDTDGLMVTAFETVDLSGALSAVMVTLDLFVQSTGWESDDAIKIGVDTDGDGEIDVTLLDTTGQDIDDLDLENTWTTLEVTLPGSADEATLLVSLDSNSSDEAIYIDSIGIFTAPLESFAFVQSFENEEVRSRIYKDEGDPLQDRDLVNVDDRRLMDSEVSSAAGTGELAFDSRWENTRDSEGMSNGSNSGVRGQTGFVGAYSDGDKGLILRDTDGNVVVDFERIDTSGVDVVDVSLDILVAETGWEKNDRIFVGVDTDGDGEADVTLLDTTGADIDTLGLEGKFTTLSARLIQPDSTSLIVEFDGNTRNEGIAIDNIVIEGQSGVAGIPAAPAPDAAMSLDYNVASVTTIPGGAEIVAKLEGTDTLAIANGAGVIFVGMSDISAPSVVGAYNPMLFGGTDSMETTSVATFGMDIAFAVPAADGTSGGTLFFGNAGGYFQVPVSSLPDAVTFSPDGNYILVAIEAESAGEDNEPGETPNPNGAVAIIQVDRDGNGDLTGGFTANEFDFTDPSLTLNALQAKGVRINEDAPSVAADIEPEFIAMEGNTAFISLQENNAIAIIEDITTFTGFTIDHIVSAGQTNHLDIGNGIDASDDDGDTVNIETRDVVGLRMHDGLAAFTVAGTTYFAGAAEGDGREVDEDRAKDANVDAGAYSDADLADENLGRLIVSTIDGDTDGDGDIDQLTAFGSRSVTIYDAQGTEVWDSGDLLARIVLAERGEAGYPDSRSDAKGVEPEFVEFGAIDGVPYLFVGLERAESVVVFDISDPTTPVYDKFIDLAGQVSEPEGLEFIPAADSPNGTPLLAVTGEDNNTLAIIELITTLESTKIGEVQGSGSESAFAGQQVQITGVVVGDYDDDGELGGFYLQDTTANADGDATTSDGIFVFVGNALGDTFNVNEGDMITVNGTVEERFGQTQIGDVTFMRRDGTDALDQVEAAVLDLPGTGSYEAEETYEAFEGMLVTIPDEMFVSEYFQLARYGQVVLTEGGRPYQFTQQNTPDVDGYTAHLEDLGQRQIILDDTNNVDNAYLGDDDVINLPDGGFSVDNFLRGGDSVTDLTGVLSWTWAGSSDTEAWRLRPTEAAPITFDSNSERDEAPDDVGGTIKVASFNVLNFFTTIDDGSNSGVNDSPNGDPRGANSEAELTRQTDKLVDAMLKMDVDVFGLVEIENEFGDQNGDGRFAVQFLVDALNAEAGPGVYDFVDPGVPTIGGDVITGAFIYDTTTVEITEGTNPAILDDSSNPLSFANAVFDGPSTNRAAFATSFTEIGSGESFIAAVNHFKSKGSINPAPGNTDAGDGAGNNNAIRLQASQSLDAWLDTDPTGSGTDRVIILGDLNAYAKEDPITFLESQGYTDLARDPLLGAGDDAYSYLFDSQLGTLDYAMSNAALTPFVTGATEWHINADEVPLLDYNDDILDSGERDFNEEPGGTDLYNADPFRTSDHDPVIVGLDFTTLDTFELA
ncbi:MAG: ExeM/NucH family extracellular endonuclease [Pseudomonadota bacterium]